MRSLTNPGSLAPLSSASRLGTTLAVPGPEEAQTQQHLKVLQDLIRRDYLAEPDWTLALRDLARMARRALGASEALVALFHPSTQAWQAINTRGQTLSNEEISQVASHSILEHVRQAGTPLFTTVDRPLALTSESIMEHELESVLVVPLQFLDLSQSRPQSVFGGCLYVHRAAGGALFQEKDITLVQDITAIVQPTLNLLRHYGEMQKSLQATREEVADLRQAVAREYRLGDLETRDPSFGEKVLGVLQRVSHADKVGLLLLGPSGAGKSHLARAYHYASPRKNGPFVVLDCAQVTSSETLAAELFGYAPRSGYANAPQGGRPGKARLAHRGTLFIDEVGCLPAELQQRLLRLLQTGYFSPLGSSEEEKVDLQIIAATNEDLGQLVRERKFREDLYWRLAEVSLKLPPLSQRPADIPGLAERFLRDACGRYARNDLEGLTEAAVTVLRLHDWANAGNMRGLEHTIARSVLLAPQGTRWLEPSHLQLQRGLEPNNEGAGQVSTPSHSGVTGGLSGPAQATSHDSAPADVQSLREPNGSTGCPRCNPPSIDRLTEAIRRHRTATAAAKALGMTRDSLIWQLRRANLTVGEVLGIASVEPDAC